MEAASERGGKGDEAPSTEIEVRHQGETEDFFYFFYFPPGLDERSVTLAYFYISVPPPEKELRLRIRQGKIRGDFTACGYPPP